MADFFKGFEQLMELAKELESKAEKGELKSNVHFSTNNLSSIPRNQNNNSQEFHSRKYASSQNDGGPSTEDFKENSQASNEIGGLKDEWQQLKDLIGLSLKKPKLLHSLGLDPTKGVLLVGPPGTGKTLVARSIAKELKVNYLAVTGPELIGKYYGEAEQRLRSLFDQAQKQAPCVILIDEIDSLVPNRESVEGEVEKRVVAQLLGLMDGFEPNAGVMLLATTNRPNSIDPALRRPGRFDREIVFGVPDRQSRVDILKALTERMPVENVDLEAIAENTPGLVGADLKALCQKAAMIALKKSVPSFDENVPDSLDITINHQDFEFALNEIKPSSLRSLEIEMPNIDWIDIGGHEEIKSILQEATQGIFEHSELYRAAKIAAPRGVLLYGEPGTGKTLLAKAVASQANANFISINGPEIMTKFIGASEEAIRDIFEKARQASPCVVFIDEIDTLAPARGSNPNDSGVSDRVVGQLLTEMDGMRASDKILVIGATNRPDAIDPALVRSGRMDIKYHVGLPDAAGRAAILEVHNHGRPLDHVDFLKWARETEDWNGADLALLANAAALNAVKEFRQKENKSVNNLKINEHHYQAAFDEILKNRID